MEIQYRVVDEWSSPSYHDWDTGEVLQDDEGEESCQRFWVVAYDPEEKIIKEWLEEFAATDLKLAVARAKDLQEQARILKEGWRY